MKPKESVRKEAEGLLRIVLFSKDLQLKDTKLSLAQSREKLALALREGRRRGVVPVFVSTMWFIFSLAISIQSAFNLVGSNAQAHDLALGLLMAWMPPLILCSIVDRNPVAAEDIRRRLNKLVDHVCESLEDEDIRTAFIRTFENRPEARKMEEWVEAISRQSPYIKRDFFQQFAGQGRVRWHYGAAHAILCDIENAYIAEHGRNWLANEEEARTNLVLAPVGEGFVWFDFRELWQIGSGVVIVSSACLGAFILSYFTPTVGLGCRSGGYMIFAVTSLTLLICEMLVWWLTKPVSDNQRSRTWTRLHSNATFSHLEDGVQDRLRRANSFFSRMLIGLEKLLMSGALATAKHVLPAKNKAERLVSFKKRLNDQQIAWEDYGIREWTEIFFFRPLELINTVWLIYIVLAQTVGAFVNCNCQTSRWSSSGGYMDLAQWDFTQVSDPLVFD